ncbi:MAG: hypothetical protein C4293_17115 [Nitrospiraceae bacterium]
MAITMMGVIASSIMPGFALGETRVVPSISVSERYDSNVFLGFAPSGLNPSDYVTNISPQIRLDHNGKYLQGVMTGGMSGELYVWVLRLNLTVMVGSSLSQRPASAGERSEGR